MKFVVKKTLGHTTFFSLPWGAGFRYNDGGRLHGLFVKGGYSGKDGKDRVPTELAISSSGGIHYLNDDTPVEHVELIIET
jgi:hypothetical protein